MILLKKIGGVIISLATICGISYMTDNSKPSNWEITNMSVGTSDISWAKFEWTNDTLGGKYFERTAMNIPCIIEGLPNVKITNTPYNKNITQKLKRHYNEPQLKNKIIITNSRINQ